MFGARRNKSFRDIDSFDDVDPSVQVTSPDQFAENKMTGLEFPAHTTYMDHLASVSQPSWVDNSRELTPPGSSFSHSSGSGDAGILGMPCADLSQVDSTTDATQVYERADRQTTTHTMMVHERANVKGIAKGLADVPVDDFSGGNSAEYEKNRAWKERKILILRASFVVCIIMLISGLLIRKKNKSQDVARGSENLTVWAGQPDNIPRWLDALDSVTDPSTFVPGAPQTSALQWISTVDALSLDPSVKSSSELTERYTAAVLYFASGGESWSSKYNFLSGGSICSWNDGGANGIGCDESGNVKEIFVVDNGLQGSIPSEVKHLRSLEMLDLYYNQLTGSIPDMSTLSALRHIDLDSNLLTGTVPDSLFNLPLLEELFLLNNPQLTGAIPEVTSDESKLQRISFYNCNLNGTIPTSLAKATDLIFFQVFNNSLIGTIPSLLSNLPSLQLFSLRANDLTGPVPDFSGQTSLETVSIGENHLRGTIPTTIAALSNLKLLHLQDNALTGTVPPYVGALQALEQIWLFSNNFEGALPSFFGNSGTLEQVFLGDNLFSGSMDPLLEHSPPSIQFLNVGGNPGLMGSVPSAVSEFQSLIYFNVSFTGLSGTIPEAFAYLNMTVLTIEGTEMVGDLTTLICGGGSTLPPSFSELKSDCAGPFPNVQCSCCTECL